MSLGYFQNKSLKKFCYIKKIVKSVTSGPIKAGGLQRAYLQFGKRRKFDLYCQNRDGERNENLCSLAVTPVEHGHKYCTLVSRLKWPAAFFVGALTFTFSLCIYRTICE